MTKTRYRWRLWTAILLVCLVVFTLLQPDVHWRLIGLARGERFYLDRPTSWWERHVETAYVPLFDIIVSGDDAINPPMGWGQLTPPSVIDRMRAWPAAAPQSGLSDAILSYGFLEATPVLLGLLQSKSFKVRQLAVFALRNHGGWSGRPVQERPAEVVEIGQIILPRLRSVAEEDEDKVIRWLAADAVQLIESGPPLVQKK